MHHGFILSNHSFSASCWEATDIPQTDGQITIIPSDCTTIPDGYGWGYIVDWYSNPPADDIHVKIPLNHSLVNGWVFDSFLIFGQYDSNGNPEIFTDSVLGGNNSFIILEHYPPEQGIPQHNNRVRLRHGKTGNCIYGVAQDGGLIRNSDCQNVDSEMTYIVKYAGGNSYRLQQEDNNQCIYTDNNKGKNSGCWVDLNMRFRFDDASGGFRLRHVNSNYCLYGNNRNSGIVKSWYCWNDPNMVYFIDIID